MFRLHTFMSYRNGENEIAARFSTDNELLFAQLNSTNPLGRKIHRTTKDKHRRRENKLWNYIEVSLSLQRKATFHFHIVLTLVCQETNQDSQEYIAWRLSFGTHVPRTS